MYYTLLVIFLKNNVVHDLIAHQKKYIFKLLITRCPLKLPEMHGVIITS